MLGPGQIPLIRFRKAFLCDERPNELLEEVGHAISHSNPSSFIEYAPLTRLRVHVAKDGLARKQTEGAGILLSANEGNT